MSFLNFLKMFGTKSFTKSSKLEKRCKKTKKVEKCTCYKNGRAMSCKKHAFRGLNKQMKKFTKNS